MTKFKKKLHQATPLFGTIQTLASPEITEIICAAGFDWLFVDLEHSAMSFRDAQIILQAANPALDCMIRVPANQEEWIKKSLDLGAAGIIIPQIQSGQEAARAVSLCKYPPEGERSVGIARAQGFGSRFDQYVSEANNEISVILQIEHIQAVEQIDTIMGVPGIDALIIGPYDLSASMGKTGLIADSDVQQAIATVKACADQASIPTGIFGINPSAVKPYLEAGYTLIAVGMDTLMLSNAAREIILALR
jgi:2-dehydro-3-deoxyglucarate aldolase/4-hydroxy-2-oxoheptanedioate aldolase